MTERDAIERLLDGEIAGPGGPLAPPAFEPRSGGREAWIKEALDRAAEAGPAGTVAKPEGRRAFPWIGLTVGVAAAAALVLAFLPGGEQSKPPRKDTAGRPPVQETIVVASPVVAERAPEAEGEPDASSTRVEIAVIEPVTPKGGNAASGSAPPRHAGETGTLNVQTKPWSKVYVDGKFVRNTPLIHHQLEPGNHTVTVRNDNLGLKRTFRVRIEAGKMTTIMRNLEEPEPPPKQPAATSEAASPPGTLNVQTKPWSKVYVDGEFVRNTPLINHQLEPGNHTVTARNDNLGLKRTFRVQIEAGKTTTIMRNLEEPEPPPKQPAAASEASSPSGTLSVMTTPLTDVYVDGKLIKKTPLIKHPLPAGSHTVVVKNAELGIERFFRVKVVAGEITTIVKDLTPKSDDEAVLRN